MEQKVFQSRHLQSGTYDPQTRAMTLTFANGQTYVAKDVPPSLWAGIKQSPSPGSFYHNIVKPMVRFEKI